MAELTLDDFRGDPRRLRKERAAHVLLWIAGFFSVAVSALIVVSLIGEAWKFMIHVDWSTVLTADGWFPRRGEYGISTLLVGSLVVTVIAMAIGAPIGMATAVYLSEYARPRVRRTLKPAIEVLAGVPSVVIGFFALTFIAPEIIQNVWSSSPQQTMMAAGVGVGVMIIPIVASISEDAMASVPGALREASYGVGARKITTVVRVVVPASISGLVAAFIIAISRAMGETMVVFIAAGKSGGSLFQADPLQPGLTMTAGMASLASGTDSVVGEGLTFQSLFFVGLVLFAITITLNLAADRFVRRVRQKY